MAYQRVNAISYIGADDVADLSDHWLLMKFKQESGLMTQDEDGNQTANIIDSMEQAAGYASWEIERTGTSALKHTQVWESESDFDAWRVAYVEDGNLLTVGEDWEVDTLESAT
jgi:hypothetical protein